jgi:hypothetical protein
MKPSEMIPKMLIGVLVGLICPCIIVMGIYLVHYSNYEVLEYIETSYSTGLLSKKLSLGAILNLAVFMLFIALKKELIARGVFIATILTGILIVYIFCLI